jgi:hypothetical protein
VDRLSTSVREACGERQKLGEELIADGEETDSAVQYNYS